MTYLQRISRRLAPQSAPLPGTRENARTSPAVPSDSSGAPRRPTSEREERGGRPLPSEKRSAKVIELRVRREAREAARRAQPAPDRPRAA